MRVILSRTRQVDQQAIDATQSGLTTTPSLQGSATEAPQVSGKVSAEVSATVSSDGSSKAGSKDSSAKDSPLGRARRRDSVSLRPRPTNLKTTKTTKTTKARKSAEEGLIRLSSTQERVLSCCSRSRWITSITLSSTSRMPRIASTAPLKSPVPMSLGTDR